MTLQIADAFNVTIRGTIFHDVHARVSTPCAPDWVGVVQQVRAPRQYPSKAACPLIKLAEFGTQRTTKGSLRSDQNMGRVYGIEGDYDAGKVPLQTALDMLRTFDIEAVVYTTPSHTPDAPRWRVLAPLSAPCSPDQRREHVGRLNAALGGILAPESFIPSQTYYIGHVAGTVYQHGRSKGQPIDELALFIDPVYPEGVSEQSAPMGREFNVMQAQHDATGDTLDDLASAVNALPDKRADDRGPWVETIYSLMSLQGTEHEDKARGLAHSFSARSAKYTPEAVDAIWDGPGSKTITYRSIFKWAAAAGWVNPRSVVAAVLTHDAEDDHSLSDVRISRMLAESLAGRFVYQHGGRGWMTFRDGAWQRCALGEEVEEGKKLGGRILEAAARDAKSLDSSKANQAMVLAKRAMSSGGISAAIQLAQSDPKIAANPDQFDVDHELLNVMNGVVHLPTGDLRPHDPALRMSRQCTVDYRRDAPCPTWHRVLAEVSVNDSDWVDYFNRVVGYTLCGHVHEEKLFFWLGHGANGKSLLANVIRRIMGSYAMTVTANFLVVSQREGEAATPTLATLPGVRLALANEVESGSRLSGQMVKVACSSEAIGARSNYGNPFWFVPTHKIWVRANHKPIIADTDEGIWRRIDLLPFDRNFAPDERDTALEEKLMEEAPGILAWLVSGYAQYKLRGLTPARRVAAASNTYRKESDLFGQWMDEETDRGPLRSCVQASAFTAYRYWCAEQGLRSPSKKSFTRNLSERGVSEGQESRGLRQRGSVRIYVCEADC